MTTKRYALTRGEPKRLTLSWGTFYSNFTIRLDGQIVATIPNQGALDAGYSFQLEDGSNLFIFRESGRVRVNLNGRPVAGSPGDPQLTLNVTVGVLVFICIANIIGGLSGGSIYNTQNSSIFPLFILGGAVLYGALAYGVSVRSKIALWIGIILYALDSIGLVILLFRPSGNLYLFPLLIHIFLFVCMWRGLSAIDDLDTRDYSSQSAKGALQPLPTRYPTSSPVTIDRAYDAMPPFAIPERTYKHPVTAPMTTPMIVKHDDRLVPAANADTLLRQAVDIIKCGGEKRNARSMVNQALQVDSRNADGWYLLGYLADTKTERKAALERTLALNPNHQRAQQELARLIHT